MDITYTVMLLVLVRLNNDTFQNKFGESYFKIKQVFCIVKVKAREIRRKEEAAVVIFCSILIRREPNKVALIENQMFTFNL